MYIYNIMGNLFTNKKPKYNDSFTNINEEKILYLRNNYQIIDVNYLDPILVHNKISNHNFLTPSEKNMANNMLKYYLNYKYKNIYKKNKLFVQHA